MAARSARSISVRYAVPALWVLGLACPAAAGADPGNLPYCAVPYMLLPDTAAVGGKSWQCLTNGVDPTLDDPVLPYCPTPLVLVPDIASVGGQRWQCPAPPPASDAVLPYCPTPLVLVPDIASVGGQRWECPT